MLLDRVKVIALCAGGWVSVVAAHMACTLQLPVSDTLSKCKTVATSAAWVSAVQSIRVDITDPQWCPVIIETGVGTTRFTSYAANVQLNAAPLTPARRMDYTFANANNVSQSTDMRLFTVANGVAYTTALGAYEAGTAGNVATKRDFVHNTIYTVSGLATGDAWLDYAYKANPTVAGVTSQPPGIVYTTAKTPLVQQPVTYQWWVDGALQGPPSGSPNYSQVFGKNISTQGIHGIKVVIIDQRKRSYTLSRIVEVKSPSCAPQRRC